MIAIVEKTNDSSVIVISAQDDTRLREQIERVLLNRLSSTAWARAYLERETIDFGGHQVAVFDTDSVVSIQTRTYYNTTLAIARHPHDLKHG